MPFRLCLSLEVGQENFLFNLIYTLIPLTACFQLRMDHPELSTSSKIQSLGCNRNQTGIRDKSFK